MYLLLTGSIYYSHNQCVIVFMYSILLQVQYTDHMNGEWVSNTKLLFSTE